MPTERWSIGDVSITKVVELDMTLGLDFVEQILPLSSKAEIEALDWLKPQYVRDGQVMMGVYAFLIDTPSRKVLVDTGVGNTKTRAAEAWNMLDTEFLRNFTAIWQPNDVDVVVSTHMHLDHVGWNTHLVDGRWEPTFTNADYYFIEPEYQHWKRLADAGDRVSEFIDAVSVFDDSVLPVVDAGLATFVEPDVEITPEVALLPSHGHTPGHVSVLVESNGGSAVITGDLMHVPCQMAYPEWSNVYDTDPNAAAATRRAFLDRFADTDTLVIGTHFGTPTGVKVRRDGRAFRLAPAV